MLRSRHVPHAAIKPANCSTARLRPAALRHPQPMARALVQRQLLALDHPHRQPEALLDPEQRLQDLAVQQAARDRLAVELAHRAEDVVDPLGRAQLTMAATATLDRRHRQIVREPVELKRRPAQRATGRQAELEKQRQVPRIHPCRTERLAPAEPDPAQVVVGDRHRLIRAVVDRPVRRHVAANHEPAKARLVDGGKIEIEHGAER